MDNDLIEDAYSCNLCYVTLHCERKDNWIRHCQSAAHQNALKGDKKLYECDLCDFKSEHRQSVHRHKKTTHTDSSESTYSCTVCDTGCDDKEAHKKLASHRVALIRLAVELDKKHVSSLSDDAREKHLAMTRISPTVSGSGMDYRVAHRRKVLRDRFKSKPMFVAQDKK